MASEPVAAAKCVELVGPTTHCATAFGRDVHSPRSTEQGYGMRQLRFLTLSGWPPVEDLQFGIGLDCMHVDL